MQLIIDIDNIADSSKKDWLINTLNLLKIKFKTIKPQTIEEYNKEIEEAEMEIERGEFTTAADLKKEAQSW